MSDYALHVEAIADLEAIWEFIADDNPDAADRIREQIYQAIQALVQFPGQGYRRLNIAGPHIRFVNVREYVVAYVPNERPLLVIAVIHGRRSPRVTASILRGRAD